MRIEICIAKEKISKMPKGSVPALQQEMLRRISKRYDDVDVIVRAASNDGLTILRAVDKESALEFVQETLQEVWQTADDWFMQ
ncbi:TPA: DinI-like family protein [Escherichia coli]|nr:DinI-like family protein [Escherichia coli]